MKKMLLIVFYWAVITAGIIYAWPFAKFSG